MTSKLKAKDPKSAEPSKPKVLVYGRPGVGKTWFSLDFPSVYYVDTEGGADLDHYTTKLKKAGGVYLGPEDGSGDLEVLIEQVQALATERHNYRTLVVDSISKPYNTAITMEAERLKDKDVFGASKKPAIALMRRLVRWCDRLDMSVVFIAHEKAEWGTVRGERTQIGQTFDCWDKLEYELHLCLRADKRGPQRLAGVRKSRLLGFPDGDEFELSYAEFSKRYGRDVIEARAKQLVLATTDQVKEVLDLLAIVKVDEGWVEKVLAKANAEHWEELTSDQIWKVRDALKKKLQPTK